MLDGTGVPEARPLRCGIVAAISSSMTITREEEIGRLLRSLDPNDGARVKQALLDAQACRESRRVFRSENRCDCFCCTLERAMRSLCYEVHRITQQPGRLWK